MGLLATVLLGATPTAVAHQPVVARPSVDVELSCEGRPCDEVSSRGQRWVIGEYGQRYSVVLTNRSGVWVEAVVSVDGRSILDGARPTSASRGYLLPPGERVEIEGWRVSRSDVAAFRFTSLGDSYAGRTGDASQAGVIRVDVYPEARPAHWTPRPRPEPWGWRGEDEVPSPSASKTADERAVGGATGRAWAPDDDRGQHLGTQYGEERWQPIAERSFERADWHRPARTITLRYDDRRGLVTRGILGGRRWIDDDWVPPPPRRPPPDGPWVPPPPLRIDE
jgi:hypothetical protein